MALNKYDYLLAGFFGALAFAAKFYKIDTEFFIFTSWIIASILGFRMGSSLPETPAGGVTVQAAKK